MTFEKLLDYIGKVEEKASEIVGEKCDLYFQDRGGMEILAHIREAFFPIKDEKGARFFIRDEKNFDEIARFRLTPLLSSSYTSISSDVSILDELHRGKGLGIMLCKLRIKICAQEGIDNIICTVTDNNKAQKKIMDKLGWKQISTSIYPRVYIYNIDHNKEDNENS